MSTRSGVPFPTARRLAWEAASALPTEEVALADAVGRTLTHDVVALIDVPHYASSAMDGWAVAGSGPWRIIDERAIRAGDAVPIVTGGLVPGGADAVLRSEHGDVADGTLTASIVPASGRHIRPAGEEARRGDVVLTAGARLNPAQVAVVAGCGYDALSVRRRPRVGFVFTGTEVVTAGIPDAGRVRDSFDPLLPAALEHIGAITVGRIRIGDDRDALRTALTDSDADLVITTGGTGDSAVDQLRPALTALDAQLIVDGPAIRPGAPTLLARIPDGPFVLGLPGNPLAAMTGLLTLAPPLLAGMAGVASATSASALLGQSMRGTPDRTTLVPYRIVDGAAVRCEHTGSGMLRGLADADGLLVVPDVGAETGGCVEVLPLPW